MKLMFPEVRVARLGPSRCVSSWISLGERLFLLYCWATFFTHLAIPFPSIFSGLSHRRYATSAVVLDTTRASCMHSSSHHPSQQQPHYSGLDVLQSFLSHTSTQEFLDLSPLCCFRPRYSELEAVVEVLDHTNVPCASSIPAMWCYPLGLFVSA